MTKKKTEKEGLVVPEEATKIVGIRAPEANYREQETEPQVPKESGGSEQIKNPEVQPDPAQELIDILNKQEIRIREMEKSQTELLQYLQDKFKNEGQNTGGDGTLGQLGGIAKTIIEGDKPPTTDERLANLAIDNMSLVNRLILKKVLGDDVESIEPSHRTV